MKRSKSVDDYIRDAEQWRPELKRLREILNTTKMKEEVKWGAPCYTHNDKNVVGVGSFKSYFGLWFHQGALLTDDNKVLLNAQEGKTKALRQLRMTSGKEIKAAVIKRYVDEAIEHIDAGHQIKADRRKPIDMPSELQRALRRHKGSLAAFRELRIGLQREYAEYISSAKRNETKRKRIEKILPMISVGAGLNDKYRK